MMQDPQIHVSRTIRKMRQIALATKAYFERSKRTVFLMAKQAPRQTVDFKISERMFGECDVLVAAVKLTGLPGIFVDETCLLYTSDAADD